MWPHIAYANCPDIKSYALGGESLLHFYILVGKSSFYPAVASKYVFGTSLPMYKQSTFSLPIHLAHLLLLALFFLLPLTYLSQKAISEWETPWGLPQEWQEPIINCVSAISFLVFSMDLLHCIHLTVFVWLPFSNVFKELHIMGIAVACRKF